MGGERSRRWLVLICLAALLLTGALLAMAWGSVNIPWQKIPAILFDPQTEHASWRTILIRLRLPRILLGLVVGGALGMAGGVFQGLLRNPMADPYLVGISAGAGFGAVMAMLFGWNFTILGLGSLPFLAFAGALTTVFVVYRLARGGGKVPVTSFLLAGVAVGFLLNALMSLMMVGMGRDLHRVFYWLMGTFSGRGWNELRLLLPYFSLGFILVLWQLRNLNLLVLGEEAALHLGVNVEQTKVILIVGASLLTASAVAVSGLIGFVGLIVPHIMRLLIGPDHRYLVPFCGLAGGTFLMWGDTLARSLFPPLEIPVGIITALAGGPFFLYLLRRHQGRYFGQGG